jgi:8-oxo-dGTP pyrophosphatase MutT (NUDIX family)
MRTIERDIVGAFIFSSDNKVLLGHNKTGGVYQDQLIVPGGGIEQGESKVDALKREVLEETGIDISNAIVIEIEGISVGESEKTLRELGERVIVRMNFHDFKVQLPLASDQVVMTFDDDYEQAQWYTSDELAAAKIGPATETTLRKLHFLQ